MPCLKNGRRAYPSKSDTIQWTRGVFLGVSLRIIPATSGLIPILMRPDGSRVRFFPPPPPLIPPATSTPPKVTAFFFGSQRLARPIRAYNFPQCPPSTPRTRRRNPSAHAAAVRLCCPGSRCNSAQGYSAECNAQVREVAADPGCFVKCLQRPSLLTVHNQR
jgi:hypothetical protein